MYFLLNMGYSIAMLVYQRVHVSNGDTEKLTQNLRQIQWQPKDPSPQIVPFKGSEQGQFC